MTAPDGRAQVIGGRMGGKERSDIMRLVVEARAEPESVRARYLSLDPRPVVGTALVEDLR